MEDWIRLINNGIDTYSIGQKLYESKRKELKRDAVLEVSKMSSLLLVGILLIAGVLIVVTTLIVSLSRYAIAVIENPLLQYLTPVGLAIIFVSLILLFRKKLYFYFTRKIAIELLT